MRPVLGTLPTTTLTETIFPVEPLLTSTSGWVRESVVQGARAVTVQPIEVLENAGCFLDISTQLDDVIPDAITDASKRFFLVGTTIPIAINGYYQ